MPPKTIRHKLLPPANSEASRIRGERGENDRKPIGRAADVIAAAGELFLSHGYSGVSLEMIVAKTGGSYRDLYKEFGSKESLFLKVMDSVCSEVLAPMRAAIAPDGEKPARLETALIEMGRRALRTLLSPKVLSLHRLVISEAPRFPELGRAFFEKGPASANKAVAALLTASRASEELAVGDPLVTAAIYLDMLTHNLQLRTLTGGVVVDDEIEQRVREATRILLDGVRPRGPKRFRSNRD